jgi:hypothetical protein
VTSGDVVDRIEVLTRRWCVYYYYYYYYFPVTYFLTAIKVSVGGGSPDTSTDKTIKNKYT